MEIIEKEMKYMLSENEYYKLINYLDNNYEKVDSFIQTNYYFDNKDLLLTANSITARLRVIDNKLFEYTIKFPVEGLKEENWSIRKEITENITEKDAMNIIMNKTLNNYNNLVLPIRSYLKENINESNLNIIGELSTIRTFYNIKNNLEPINIDINNYIFCKDYELEWETQKCSIAKEIIEDIFYKVNINPFRSMYSKKERFMRNLKTSTDKIKKNYYIY